MLAGGQRWHRIKAQQKRVNKVGKLKKILHERAVGIYRAGPMAAAQYGANAWGTDDQEMWAMQTQALATMTPAASGRSRLLALLLSRDPTWRPAVEPIMQWVTIIWKVANDLSPGKGHRHMAELIKAWRAMEKQPPTKWPAVKGPMGVLVMAMKRLGWEQRGPLQITYLQGLGAHTLRISQDVGVLGTERLAEARGHAGWQEGGAAAGPAPPPG